MSTSLRVLAVVTPGAGVSDFLKKLATLEYLINAHIIRGLCKIQVFGSFARDEQKKDSDIDILLEMEHPVGLMALSRYHLDLEKLIGLEVDLGTTKGVSKYARSYIETDLETMYEK